MGSIKPIHLLIFLGMVCLAILAGTIIAYNRSSLIHFSGQIDKDFFPAFGNFIGGTIGLILSIATVILIFYTYQSQQEQLAITRNLVNRQISLSIKPELVIQDYNTLTEEIPPSWTMPEFDGLTPPNLQNINLKIINVGIEAAQYIEYKFEYKINEMVDYMVYLIKKPPLNLVFQPDEVMGSLTRVDNNFQSEINILSPLRIKKKDFLLPFKLNSASINVPFPYIVVIYYFYTFITLKRETSNVNSMLVDFPDCFLNISYQDLEGQKHTKKFNLLINVTGIKGNMRPEEISNFNIAITSTEMVRDNN
jgi:hypothetical protein